jgi:hypothetical protein
VYFPQLYGHHSHGDPDFLLTANGRYDIAVKNAMGTGASGGTTTTAPPPTTTTTAPPPPTTTTTSGGAANCAGVAAWSSAVAVCVYIRVNELFD